MERRLFKTRNSVVISLLKEILDSLGLAVGEKVSMVIDKQQRQVILTPSNNPLTIAGVDEEFTHQVNEFIENYRTALEALAK